jgi:hypothetical protein
MKDADKRSRETDAGEPSGRRPLRDEDLAAVTGGRTTDIAVVHKIDKPSPSLR